MSASYQVDLRSDTVTRPTPAMRDAMMAAPLGDDVLGDDPSVAALEEKTATLLGKKAAVYVPSGTMSNQIGIASWTRPAECILAEEEAHILFYECGGPATISNVMTWTVASDRGAMDPELVERRITKYSIHTPATTLLCVENTHNRAGGTIVPMEYLAAYREVCDRHGMHLHLDGARVWNAAVKLGLPVSEIAAPFDSLSVCLSKGMGAPVGSVLVGPTDFIERARQWRKRLGGGMRQAGVIAAAGIYALDNHIERLSEDHARATRLSEGLSEVPGLRPHMPETNIVLVDTEAPAEEWADRMAARGVSFFPTGPNRFRMVTHLDVSEEGVAHALEAFRA
ncbi:aminotransferase class I/II-fold pyridoxal phosphate-dependent enzyme [bacterium]|nr:MAG: aminotransferase class I/II-fold pyridoxal phosphate-dependent enzyme [bacterium]